MEVCFVDGSVHVRNSRSPARAELIFTTREWLAFLAGVRRNEFDPASAV